MEPLSDLTMFHNPYYAKILARVATWGILEHRGFEVRFVTSPGEQSQVDCAQFLLVFTNEPTTSRIVQLLSVYNSALIDLARH